jgi:putative SOS response-associated peptidase YedK
MAPMIRRPRADAIPGDRGCARDMFGIVPHWAKDTAIARHTCHAWTETVAEKPSYRNAFKLVAALIVPEKATARRGIRYSSLSYPTAA